MNVRFCAVPARIARPFCLFLIILLALSASRPAIAQWTTADAQTAFNNYNDAFYFNPSGDNYDYRVQQGSTTTSGFWVGAEEIELAIDAYNNSPTTTNYNIINQLCNGFVAQYSSNWSGDSYDDDLMWATIAFTRAYNATGNSTWLSDAETNFAVVWNRGYDTTYGGGIWWNASQANTSSGYKNSAANWTFVIAGYLLYNATGDSTYQSEANTIYSWAYSNLYVASTGEIYDGINNSGISNGQYSYNYGVAVGAQYFENNWSDATNVANYLMNNESSGTVNGYNILPNYGQGGTDGGGFNGIALRWIGYAYTQGALSNTNILTWAQTNVNQAWSEVNSQGLSWNDWLAATPYGGLYSWDCSDTVVGMLDIPPGTPSLNGSHVLIPRNATGSRLDDYESGTASGNTIDIWGADNTGAQIWVFSNVGVSPSGYYNIAVSYGAYCVTASGSTSGSVVNLQPCNGSTGQAWNAVLAGNGVYAFQPANNTSLCLNVQGALTTNGTPVIAYTCNGGSNEQWALD
jgi:hypothetical protein